MTFRQLYEILKNHGSPLWNGNLSCPLVADMIEDMDDIVPLPQKTIKALREADGFKNPITLFGAETKEIEPRKWSDSEHAPGLQTLFIVIRRNIPDGKWYSSFSFFAYRLTYLMAHRMGKQP